MKPPHGYPARTGNRIWEVSRTEKGWGTPVPFDTTASQGHDYAHSVSSNGTIYFSSGIPSETNWNIRRSEKINGRYIKPELLPYDINSKDYEDGAYIAPDESFLIFESQRPDGTEGNLSLFICFKNKNGQWSSPVNMGPKINSGKGERFARLSPDGKYLFFGSFRNPLPGSRGADIYWIDAKVIEELRNTQEAKTPIDHSLGKNILEALNNKNNNRAATLLKDWLQSHPNSLDALVLYSAALRRQHRYAEAEQLFKTNHPDWNNNNGIQMERALIRIGLKDEAGARKLLVPVLAQPMDLRKKYAHLADELFSMKEYLLSDEYFEMAYALRPNATSLYNRGCAYALIGENTKAFELLNKAVDNGFNSKQQFEQDHDLKSLQSDMQWKELQKRLR
jgi:tetratricopeptide (TPR) repeat protein